MITAVETLFLFCKFSRNFGFASKTTKTKYCIFIVIKCERNSYYEFQS